MSEEVFLGGGKGVGGYVVEQKECQTEFWS